MPGEKNKWANENIKKTKLPLELETTVKTPKQFTQIPIIWSHSTKIGNNQILGLNKMEPKQKEAEGEEGEGRGKENEKKLMTKRDDDLLKWE